jgi:hypothetical protein
LGASIPGTPVGGEIGTEGAKVPVFGLGEGTFVGIGATNYYKPAPDAPKVSRNTNSTPGSPTIFNVPNVPTSNDVNSQFQDAFQAGLGGFNDSTFSGKVEPGIVVFEPFVVTGRRSDGPTVNIPVTWSGDGAAAARVANMLLRIGTMSADEHLNNSAWRIGMDKRALAHAIAVFGADSGAADNAAIALQMEQENQDALAADQAAKAGRRQ